MKRFLMLLTLSLTCLCLLAPTADAKRFGGGGSIGKQRSMSAPMQRQQSPAAAPAQTPAAQPATVPQSQGNKWLGPLAGLAIGAGLGALFAGSGLGGAMGGILMALLAAVAVMFLISLFRKKQQPAMQYAGAGAPYAPPQEPSRQPMSGSVTTSTPAASSHIPADFPVDAFLRSAKTSFIRLQAANDRKDLNDIREYTTPEMYAEISMQMNERGSQEQKTEVINVTADLLEVATEGELAIASVRLTGELRENNGPLENFDEVWHVQKNLKDDQSVWLLSGIQQIA